MVAEQWAEEKKERGGKQREGVKRKRGKKFDKFGIFWYIALNISTKIVSKWGPGARPP